MGSYLVRIAEAKYLIGEDEAAVRFALRALAQPSFQWSRYAILIAALGQLGRQEEAHHYLVEVTRMRPDFSMTFVRTMHPFVRDMVGIPSEPRRAPSAAARERDVLRSAGPCERLRG